MEIEQRLKTLQRDFSSLQEEQESLKAYDRAKMTALELQIEELTNREDQLRKEGEIEREKIASEWEQKTKKLEEALELSKACAIKSIQVRSN